MQVRGAFRAARRPTRGQPRVYSGSVQSESSQDRSNPVASSAAAGARLVFIARRYEQRRGEKYGEREKPRGRESEQREEEEKACKSPSDNVRGTRLYYGEAIRRDFSAVNFSGETANTFNRRLAVSIFRVGRTCQKGLSSLSNGNVSRRLRDDADCA